MAAKPPDAFLSYTRFDDRRGDISAFREALSDAVQAVTGVPFQIFQDVEGIGVGKHWQGKLDRMLDEARFFIPILTPSYFTSEPCRDELAKFLRAEAERGRNDLVLPIYYIESEVLEKDERRGADPLAQAIHARQRLDWRDLRFEPFDAKEVRRALQGFARSIEIARARDVRPTVVRHRVDRKGRESLFPPDEAQSAPPDEGKSPPPDEAQSAPADEAQSPPADEAQSLPPDEAESAPQDEAQSPPPDEAQSAPADEAESPPPDEVESRTQFIPDDAELERDLLNRGPLAIALARYIHRIWLDNNDVPTSSVERSSVREEGTAYDSAKWTGAQSLEHTDLQYREKRQASRAGFVIHLDAPWGGGKTTFANFISSVLNPLARPTGERSFLSDELGANGAPAPVFLADVEDRHMLAGWPEDARRPWIVVTFNAWQNEHIDPPWWAFYQAIRRQCFTTLRREGCEAFDEEGDRQGPGIRLDRLARVSWLWLLEYCWRLESPKLLLLLLTTLVSVLLFLSFRAFGVFGQGNTLGTTVGAVIVGLTGVGSLLWSLASLVTESILPGTSSLNERLSLGSGDPYERFRRHFHELCRRFRRPVLGDRDWIERAFESEHQDMSAIDVGEEQSFGARFVEKAIQISLLLPDTSQEQKMDYVKAILTGDEDERKQGLMEKRDREIVRETIRETDLSDIVTAQTTVSERLQKKFEKVREDEGRPPPDARQIQRFTAAEIVKKAGHSEAVTRHVEHQLVPLAGALPPNPRQIKRIINAITIYQLFAAVAAGEGPDHMPLTPDRWQQLVLWIVLMTEWPYTWRLLTRHPWLADLLHAGKDRWKKLDAEARNRLPENQNETVGHVQRIREDPRIMRVLNNPDFNKERRVQIDAEAVSWLRQLTPVFGADAWPKIKDVGNIVPG